MIDRCDHCGAIKRFGAVARIQDIVSAYYDVDPDSMCSERQDREVAWPRQVAMYLAREITGKSYPAIGRMFDRDHSTVISALRAVEDRQTTSPTLRADIEYLRGMMAA